jgi:Protein of unknown function (DUF2934)
MENVPIETTRPRTRRRSDASAERRALRPSDDAIASRAYELFLARGAQHGSDVEDWLQAERELSDPAAAEADRLTRGLQQRPNS